MNDAGVNCNTTVLSICITLLRVVVTRAMRGPIAISCRVRFARTAS